MFLALREIRRGLVRFVALALAVGLLLFLVLFQQALQRGLVTAFVGAIRNQNAPVVVYSVDGQRTLQGSVIVDTAATAALGVDGIGESARLSQGTFAAAVNGGSLEDTTIIASDNARLGWPSTLTSGRLPQAPGEAVGSDADMSVGDRVTVAAEHAETLTVVGTAADIQLSVTPTLFTDRATYERLVRAANPAARAVPVNVLLLAPVQGVAAADLAERVNAVSGDLDAVTRSVAASTTPGVDQVQQSFTVIFALYGLVVPLVIGLFFLIVTLQKRRSLTLLRAMGAPAGLLARSLAVQVLIVTGVGVLVGAALFAPLAGRRVGGLVLRMELRTVVTWGVVFVALAVLGSLASLRRVLRVDPVTAASGEGDR